MVNIQRRLARIEVDIRSIWHRLFVNHRARLPGEYPPIAAEIIPNVIDVNRQTLVFIPSHIQRSGAGLTGFVRSLRMPAGRIVLIQAPI